MTASPWEAGQMYHVRTHPVWLSKGANRCPRRLVPVCSLGHAHLPLRRLVRGVPSSAGLPDRDPVDEQESESCGCGEKPAARVRAPWPRIADARS